MLLARITAKAKWVNCSPLKEKYVYGNFHRLNIHESKFKNIEVVNKE